MLLGIRTATGTGSLVVRSLVGAGLFGILLGAGAELNLACAQGCPDPPMGGGGSGGGGSGNGGQPNGPDQPGDDGQGGPPSGGGQPPTPDPGGGPTTGGGQTPTPTDIGGGPTTGSGPGPITPGGAPPSGGPNGPGGRGPTTGGGGGPRPGSGGAGLAAKKSHSTPDLDRFDVWWDLNGSALLEELLDRRRPETERTGFVVGGGARGELPRARLPNDSILAEEILPALRMALKDDDARVIASAATALGRATPAEMAGDSLERIEAALARNDSSVRDSALLALGLLRDRAAVRVLWQVMNDTTEGRATVGAKGAIDDRTRSLAVLALGLSKSSDAASQFRRLLQRRTTNVEVAASALLSLGLLGPDAADCVPMLGEMLCDRELDRRVRAQVPVALARIGAEAQPLLPYLLQFARDVREDDLVRTSCVIGLGRLAAGYDGEIMAELCDLARSDREASVRHQSLVAIAQVAPRGGASVSATSLDGAARFLAQQCEKPKNKADQPWAALAAGLLAMRIESGDSNAALVAALTKGFRSTSNPDCESAFALGLGLANARPAGRELVERFERTSDAKVRGFLGLGLGMLDHRDATQQLRDALAETDRASARVTLAQGLALLGDRSAADPLLARLETGANSAEARGLARAVAHLEDSTAVTRLANLVRERTASAEVRSACCEALGLIAERSALPYTAALSLDLNPHSGLRGCDAILERL